MTISPDDQFLATLDSDGLVTGWNLETGAATGQWQDPSNGVIVNGRFLFSKVRNLSGLHKGLGYRFTTGAPNPGLQIANEMIRTPR
jgi:hypothetical protein